MREASCLVAGNLEPGFGIVDPDRADITLRDAAGVADHRQQEFRIRTLPAPERYGEPDTVLHDRAAWLASRSTVLTGPAGTAGAPALQGFGRKRQQVLGNRVHRQLLAQERRREALRSGPLQQFGHEVRLRPLGQLGRHGGIEDLTAIARLDLRDPRRREDLPGLRLLLEGPAPGDGTVATGRPIERTGAHVKGHNTGTIGVSLFGGHGSAETDAFSDHFTEAQDAALRELLADLDSTYGPGLKISGHNEYAAKACPGFNVAKWLSGALPPVGADPAADPDYTAATKLRWRLAEIRDTANRALAGE